MPGEVYNELLFCVLKLKLQNTLPPYFYTEGDGRRNFYFNNKFGSEINIVSEITIYAVQNFMAMKSFGD